MGKRGNENGQMRKEEYEAAERQSQDDTTGGQMQRANEEVLQQRRIVRARKVAPAATATDQASSGTGVFAKINLTAGAPSASGFSFSSFAPAPAATAPTTTATAPQAASGFTFGTSSALTVVNPSTIATNPVPAPSAELEQLEKEREQDLFNDHENFLTSTNTYQKEQIVHKMLRNIRKRKQLILDAERASAPSAVSGTNASSTALVVAPAPATTSTSTAITSPAVSTGSFSFGAANAPAPSSGGFFFGAPSAPAAAAPANSAPSSGGFSFGASSATQSALTSPVNTAASLASNQPPPADEGEPSDEIPKNQTGAVVQEVADPDWDDIGSFEPVTIFRNENSTWKLFLSKTRLRLQTSKTDASRHRMVARDAMGKPLVNMSIQAGMGFTFAEQANKRGPFASILFMGTNDAEKGPEKFMIKMIQVAEGKRLHQKLNELCSK